MLPAGPSSTRLIWNLFKLRMGPLSPICFPSQRPVASRPPKQKPEWDSYRHFICAPFQILKEGNLFARLKSCDLFFKFSDVVKEKTRRQVSIGWHSFKFSSCTKEKLGTRFQVVWMIWEQKIDKFAQVVLIPTLRGTAIHGNIVKHISWGHRQHKFQAASGVAMPK